MRQPDAGRFQVLHEVRRADGRGGRPLFHTSQEEARWPRRGRGRGRRGGAGGGGRRGGQPLRGPRARAGACAGARSARRAGTRLRSRTRSADSSRGLVRRSCGRRLFHRGRERNGDAALQPRRRPRDAFLRRLLAGLLGDERVRCRVGCRARRADPLRALRQRGQRCGGPRPGSGRAGRDGQIVV